MELDVERLSSAFPAALASGIRTLFASLSSEQLAVVAMVPELGILVVGAAAGSGKTRVALAILVRLVAEARLARSSRRPLVPTFTRAARDELRDRLTGLLGNTGGCVLVTFEHLMRMALRETGLWDRGIWTRGQEVDWLIAEVGELLCGQLPNHFWWSGLRPQLDRVVDLIARGQVLEPEIAEFVLPAWERMRKEAERAGDLVEDGVGVLVVDYARDLASHLERHPGWLVGSVVIDEWQDCAPRHLAIPLVLAESLPVVGLGDENQAIMGFQGGIGDPRPLVIAAGLPVTDAALTTNYRSTVALCRAQGGLLAAHLGAAPDTPRPRPDAPAGAPPLQAVVATKAELYDALSYAICVSMEGAHWRAPEGRLKERLEVGLIAAIDRALEVTRASLGLDHVLVMVPSNAVGREFHDALHERGIPSHFDGRRTNPYEGQLASLATAWAHPPQPDIPFLLALPSLVTVLDALVEHDLVAPADALFRGAEFLADVAATRSLPGASLGEAIELAIATARSQGQLAPNDCAALERLEDYLGAWFQPPVPVDERLALLVAHLPLLATSVAVRDPVREPSTLTGWPLCFIRLVEEEVCPRGVGQVLGRWARVWERGTVPCERQPGEIELRTVHRSKGLTRSATFLVRAELIGRTRVSAFADSSARDTERLAQARLGYVAASRGELAHVELSLRRRGCFHSPTLPAWEYFGPS